jgi:hypothetical protein
MTAFVFVVLPNGNIEVISQKIKEFELDSFFSYFFSSHDPVAGPDVTDYPLLSAGMQGLQMPVLLQGKDLNLIQV